MGKGVTRSGPVLRTLGRDAAFRQPLTEGPPRGELASMSPPSTLAPVRGAFRAVARAVAPASAELDENAWLRGEAVVDESLAERSSSVRRQVVLFVHLLGVLARLRWGRGLASLPAHRVRALLSGLERSGLLLMRRGVWGVRTLAFMAVYAQAEVRTALGYRAAAAGWEARGGFQGPWPGRAGAGAPEPGILTAGEEPPHA